MKKSSVNLKYAMATFAALQVIVWLLIICSTPPGPAGCSVTCRHTSGQAWSWSRSTQPALQFRKRGKHQSMKFLARFLHGNRKRGIKNKHLNIRSVYNKNTEIKQLVRKEKPHILGISEAQLGKSESSWICLVAAQDLEQYWHGKDYSVCKEIFGI